MSNLPKIPKLAYLTRKFVCRECCVGYDTSTQWDRHIQDRHEKKVECKYRCGETFPVRRGRNLRRHEETCYRLRKPKHTNTTSANGSTSQEIENIKTPPDFGIVIDQDPDLVSGTNLYVGLPSYNTSEDSLLPFGMPAQPEPTVTGNFPFSSEVFTATPLTRSVTSTVTTPPSTATSPLVSISLPDIPTTAAIATSSSITSASKLTSATEVSAHSETSTTSDFTMTEDERQELDTLWSEIEDATKSFSSPASLSMPAFSAPEPAPVPVITTPVSTPAFSAPMPVPAPVISTPVSTPAFSVPMPVPGPVISTPESMPPSYTPTPIAPPSLSILPRFKQVQQEDYRLVKVKNIPLEVDNTHAVSNYEYLNHDPRTYLRGAPSAYASLPNSGIIKEQRIRALQLGVNAAETSYAFQGTVVIKKEKVQFANGDIYSLETTIVPQPSESTARPKSTQTPSFNCQHCGRHPYL